MALSIRNLDRICLLLVVAVTCLVGFWVWRDGMEQRMASQQRQALLTKRTGDLALADAGLERLRGLAAEKKATLQNVNRRVPDSAEIGKLIRQMDGWIKARDIKLVSIQPRAKVKTPSYTRIPIRIVLTGSFPNTYHLLRDLEGADRLIDVVRMQISEAGNGRNCRIDLTANVFER